MRARTNNPQPTNPALRIYAQIEAIASEIERDERAIKDFLIDALKKGQTAFALRIIQDWRTTPPRDVVSRYLEDDDGNSK